VETSGKLRIDTLDPKEPDKIMLNKIQVAFAHYGCNNNIQ